MNVIVLTFFFLIGFSALIPQALAVDSDDRPDAYAQWLADSYSSTGTGMVRVVDHYINQDPEKIESLVADVYVEETDEQIKVTLNETGIDTGIFEGIVLFTETEKSFGNKIRVAEGDIISVEYIYSQVPGSDLLEDLIGVGHEITIKNSQEHEQNIVDSTIKKMLMTPLQQTKQGIPIDEISCDKDMVLAIKYDGTPACVIPLTLTKLMARGWVYDNSDTVVDTGIQNTDYTKEATVHLDQDTYTWTDKVYITIVAPGHNIHPNLIDEIGNSPEHPIKISTRGHVVDQYLLVETGTDTGIFTGEVILTGFEHDADGYPLSGDENGNDVTGRGPSGHGSDDGFLPTDDDDGIVVSFEFFEDETVVGSALIRWNTGEIQWLEQNYSGDGTGVVRVVDPDMNLDPDAVDNFDVNVWSDTDIAGIDLTVTETNEATGIFEGTVFFSASDESSGHRLRISGGDTITARYEDHTLPDPYTTADELDIVATATVSGVDPLVDDVENRIELDKNAYTWTDKVHIILNAPEHNLDGNLVEYIGNSKEHPIKISTSSFDLDNYRLVESEPNSGIFVGEITLTGNQYHDANGDGNENDASGTFSYNSNDGESMGPTDGFLPVYGKDTGLSVSFEYVEDKTAIASVPITWNTGTVQWLEPSYYLGNIGNMMVTDPDMNLNPEEKDTIVIDVWSDSDAGGVDIVLTETGVETGVFKGTIVFTDEESSGDKLQVAAGDIITAEYEDNTLPNPHSSADEIDVAAETIIN